MWTSSNDSLGNEAAISDTVTWCRKGHTLAFITGLFIHSLKINHMGTHDVFKFASIGEYCSFLSHGQFLWVEVAPSVCFCVLFIIIILQLVLSSCNIKLNIWGAIRRYTQFQNRVCALEQCLHFAFLAIAMSLYLKETYEVLCYLSLLIEKLLGLICTVRRIFFCVFFFFFEAESHGKSISSGVLWLLPLSAW